MPNWCANNLYVSGDLTRFNEWLKNEFLFNKIVSMPSELKDSEPFNDTHPRRHEFKRKYGAGDWYDWRVKNWGTKWDIEDATIDECHPTMLAIRFETAWSPPQKAIQTLSTFFPELKFKLTYLEEGMGFVGYDTWSGGEYEGGESSEDSSTDEWKKIASEEFGWEESQEVEA